MHWCEELGAAEIAFLGLSSVIAIVEHIPGELFFEISFLHFRALCILGIGFSVGGFGYRVLICTLDCRFLVNLCLIFSMFRCCPTTLTLMCSLWSPFNRVYVSCRFVGGICCNKCILVWVSGNFTSLWWKMTSLKWLFTIEDISWMRVESSTSMAIEANYGVMKTGGLTSRCFPYWEKWVIVPSREWPTSICSSGFWLDKYLS